MQKLGGALQIFLGTPPESLPYHLRKISYKFQSSIKKSNNILIFRINWHYYNFCYTECPQEIWSLGIYILTIFYEGSIKTKFIIARLCL